MPTLVIKTNASQGTDVTIKDVGVIIANSGGSDTWTDTDAIRTFQKSRNLRTYVTDDAHGAGSSTLILNDGSGDLAQADALNWLDTVVLPDGDADYGVVKTDASGQVTTQVTFDGSAGVDGLPTPTAASDAATKQYVDEHIIDDDEVILVEEQLDQSGDTLRQAIPFYLDGQPVADTDTFTIDDGTTTEVFDFVTTDTGAFEIEVGADADETMDNMATIISAESTLWDAVVATSLNSINDGSGSSTAGRVLVIYRTIQLDAKVDRIYGSLTTPANGQYVNYNGLFEYTDSTSATLPSSDPTTKSFGIGKIETSLVEGEQHVVRETDSLWFWDGDSDAWVLSGGTSPKLIGKILQFGAKQSVPGGGTLYMGSAGDVITSAAGLMMFRAGQLTAGSVSVDAADGSRAFKLSVMINGSEVETIALAVSDLEEADTFTTTYSAGDNLSVALIRTSGVGASTFANASALVEYKDV